ncbi:hypothetical protein LguiA_009317 [Lonicera macranthoides]
MDRPPKELRRFNSSSSSFSSDVFEPSSNSNAKQRVVIIEWLCSILPDLRFPIITSDEELRAFLIDGTVLCRILNRLRPGSVTECAGSENSNSENVKRFLAAMDEIGLPRFEVLDLEKGSMKIVMECLLSLKAQFMAREGGYTLRKSSSAGNDASMRWNLLGLGGQDVYRKDGSSRPFPFMLPTDRRKSMPDSKFRRALRSPTMSEPSAALLHHVGHKFQEVFQMKHGGYGDLSAAKISEMMKANSLDNAPTHSLLSVVNGIIDESVERKNGEIPHRVACLLRKVVQEIERRISTQAENFKNQKATFKAREEKYQSRIRVLETLATGSNEETQIAKDQIEQIKTENTKVEEEKKVERMIEQKDQSNQEIAALKKELEIARKKYEQQCSQMETDAKETQKGLEEKLKEVERLLAESRNKVKELEAYSESKNQGWNKKDHIYQRFTEFQLGVLSDLRFASQSIKQEIVETQKSYLEDFKRLGMKTRALEHAAENYHVVLAENRKLHNEVQDLKGNIRVYCRIRPFLPGQMGKQSIVDYIGDNGELVVVNPSKPGKEGRRSFKFNKVYGPAATQAEVFSDIRPLIRSVLDGYNVCIFAYGQTGSGKTYTMTGPDGATEEEWGVNYRALNDLFRISQSRQSTIGYEIGVQMVEVYNEQVRDILSSDAASKRLGILSTSQSSGLAVPDASMHTVTKTSDVLNLMEIGLKNRAKSSTAMNERSSRSHSIVTIHVRGNDLKTGAVLRASLHLVDLAGSERVDRSEVVGDRLKEAQHINKSLAALGDVIFALSQKSAHVPYRNSKLTQVLQSSLGGQAKTLMFVQLNPDLVSFSESSSTLKFAERVSGVELGAARSNKEGRDVKELMDQVVSLQDTISKKEEEIERLQLLKDLKNVYQGDKVSTGSSRQ